MVGTLQWLPVDERIDLVAPPVERALSGDDSLARGRGRIRVAAIDPDVADTAAFSETYGVAMEDSANCVVVAVKRGGERRMAACVILATTRADVNGVVRRHLEARKASFASVDDATAASGMEFGGITPIGLPSEWPLLVDEAVAARDEVVVGSGVRRSKLLVPGRLVAELPGAEVLAITTP